MMFSERNNLFSLTTPKFLADELAQRGTLWVKQEEEFIRVEYLNLDQVQLESMICHFA